MLNVTSQPDPYARERRHMVESQLRNRGIRDEGVLEAMLRVPRHQFVPQQFAPRAYDDHPIPIAENQTISPPFIMSVSLRALPLPASACVLSVGTASGYQTT